MLGRGGNGIVWDPLDIEKRFPFRQAVQKNSKKIQHMNTDEMRLLTVPEFAKRVRRSHDEVYQEIQDLKIKALRPDPKSGYRILETEVERYLHESGTRIRPHHPVNTNELESRLVTQLETMHRSFSRLERRNAVLEEELRRYRAVMKDEQEDLNEHRCERTRLGLKVAELSKALAEARLEAENLEKTLVTTLEKNARKRPWWKRWFSRRP